MVLCVEQKKYFILNISHISIFRPSLKVCLFEGEIRWMKNFGEKMGRKIFLSVNG